MTTDSETTEKYLNFVRTGFLISALVYVSRDYKLGRVSDLGGVDRSPYAANFYVISVITKLDWYIASN